MVYSYSILHHPRHPRFDYPLVAVLVELDEHVRIVSNLIGDAAMAPSIGLAVRVAFVPTDHGYAVPVFDIDRNQA